MPTFNIRRSLPTDAPALNSLIAPSQPILARSYPWFNIGCISNLIEKSYLALTCEVSDTDSEENTTTNSEICGFVVFENEARLSDEATETIYEMLVQVGNEMRQKHDSSSGLSSNPSHPTQHTPHAAYSIGNSLFLSFIHIEPLYLSSLLPQIHDTIFTTYPLVDDILVLRRASGMLEEQWLRDARKVDEWNNATSTHQSRLASKYNLYAINRQQYIPKLRIRLGRVEDNDDLVPLLQLRNLTTLQWEGEFWLSTKLHDQNEHRKVLVAENVASGEIVGVMYVTTSERDAADVMTQFKLIDYNDFIAQLGGAGQQEDDEWDEAPMMAINAFEIKMFFIQPEFQDRSVDFVHAAFQMFPHLKYGSIFLPFEESEHPCLEPFVVAEPKLDVEVHEALHVVSRDAFYDQLCVSELNAESENTKEIYESIVRIIPSDQDFLASLRESTRQKESPLTTLIIRNQDARILGVAIVSSDFQNLQEFNNHYNLGDFIDLKKYSLNDDSTAMVGGSVGQIHHIHLTPLYTRHSTQFLRHVMSLCNFGLLIYKPNDTPAFLLNKEMVCLTERRQIEKSDQPLQLYHNYPVYFITQRLMSEPKTENHSRIVVVGASKTGLSFIKTLVMIPYLYFTNITLVSPDGIPDGVDSLHNEGDESPAFNHEAFFGEDATEFNNAQMRILLNRPNITVVKDKLEQISRKSKMIACVDDQLICYEILILATSRLYKLPASLTELESFPNSGVVDLRNHSSFFEELQAYVEHVVLSPGNLGHIILYGSNCDMLCTAQALVEKFHIPQSRLVFVCPEGTSNIFQGDKYLESKVAKQLEHMSIKKYDYFSVDNFDMDDHGGVKRVIISNTPELQMMRHGHGHQNGDSAERNAPRKKLFEISCSLLINCYETNVDKNMLVTFNHESLVFDGRLIVDPQFRTTDNSIYSAGPLAKFSRRFGVSQKMELSNAHELGEKMAFCALNSSLGVDELYKDNIEPHLTLIQKIPTFDSRVTKRGIFVGGYRYFKCHVRDYKADECEILYTDANDRYSRIAVHKTSGVVLEVTTFCKEQLEENNLSALVGMPSAYLNGLVIRYTEGLVPDLINFLRENWALALFCDQFKKFRKEIFENITQDSPDVEKFAKRIIQQVQSGEKFSWTEAEYEVDEVMPLHAKQDLERELVLALERMQNIDGLIDREVYYIPRVGQKGE
uniref:Cilia- and flagella-associated protein 61 N-terminal domain-containing protein n=1 Tax=Percolomonas cosmopolitus TaxID=63605 RepID=A0A7S1KSD1_9EUKA